MQANFLLGPAGSGKTQRCLAQIRAALTASPEGPPLLFLAPKQATFQLERQLLSDATISGYARLQILSFERLADFVFDRLGKPIPPLLSESGRIMVLRALLTRHHPDLQVFRASARWPGFARQLSQLIREFQQHQLSSTRLDELASRIGAGQALGRKLQDAGRLMRAYQDWLAAQAIEDADRLLQLAAEEIKAHARAAASAPAESRTPEFPTAKEITQSLGSFKSRVSDFGVSSAEPLHLGGLWLDGFAEMTPQELGLLTAILPFCEQATLAFCLEREPESSESWLSPWTVVGQTYRRCRLTLENQPNVEVAIELLPRHPRQSRFQGNPLLRHIEMHWTEPPPLERSDARKRMGTSALLEKESSQGSAFPSLRLVCCPHPEAEAVLAAREILRRIREEGGRFRDCAVLVRSLTHYHDILRRVFARYDIPFFLDRREPVAHHPLAELVRYALRTVAYGWKPEDWFGALKTGLVPASTAEIDQLENAALASGWKGADWLQPLKSNSRPAPETLEMVRQRLAPPFHRLQEAIGKTQFQPNGLQLANALRDLWEALDVAQRLQRWTEAQAQTSRDASAGIPASDAIHQTVWEQMQDWLANLERAFVSETMPLREWLAVVESGLTGLTVGVVPPALDQVLIGAIDRSRNPDLRHVWVLGLNERVFPAPPPRPVLLTEAERNRLLDEGHLLGATRQQQLGHERYFGYIACTRARDSVTLSWSARDAKGAVLNPSCFVDHLKRLVPSIPIEQMSWPIEPAQCQHLKELAAPLIQAQAVPGDSPNPPVLNELIAQPELQPVLAKARLLSQAMGPASLQSGIAERLFGNVVQVSISALEDFAACPFKFYVRRGLRAREREEFVVDHRERGSFQHEVLKLFHQRVQAQGRLWRYVDPVEAQVMVMQIGQDYVYGFRNGLFAADPQRQLQAEVLIANLVRLVGTLIDWMRTRYEFDPRYAELSFGLDEQGLPGWTIPLDQGHSLLLRGRIDRVDVCHEMDLDIALVSVMDYKSSEQKLDPTRLHHGLDLQLLSYLCLLNQFEGAEKWFGAPALRPAGAFYINLRGKAASASTRADVLDQSAEDQSLAYQHRGRFDVQYRRYLDNSGEDRGAQFSFKINKDGSPRQGGEALPPESFAELLRQTEARLRRFGNAILAGDVNIAPYRIGAKTACDHCDFRGICRFDPWVSAYRALSPPPKVKPENATTKVKAKTPRRSRAKS